MNRLLDLLDITKLGSTAISIVTALLCITFTSFRTAWPHSSSATRRRATKVG